MAQRRKRNFYVRILRRRDGDHCWVCRHPMRFDRSAGQPIWSDVTIDHVVPRALGGPTVLENLKLAHALCNAARHSYTPERLRLAIEPLIVIVRRKDVRRQRPALRAA